MIRQSARSPVGRLLAGALFSALACFPPTLGAQDTATPAIRTFLGTYCAECHGPEKQKAERRFDQLALPIVKADTLLEVQDIIDQLNLGEMPPEKAKKHPAPAEVAAVVAHLTQLAAAAQARLASTGGQTVLRRLNRREYLNTVSDLFALNLAMFDPTTKFPRDQSVQHMDNIGDALKTSGYLLAQYVDAADQIVEKALATPKPPAERTWRFTDNFQQQPELRYSHGRVQNFRYMCLYESAQSTQHEGAYGPLLAFAQGVPADGTYEIRVKAEAKNRQHPYDQKIFGTDPAMPFRLGVVAGQAKVGPLHQPQPIEPQLGETIVKDEVAEWHTFRVWLDRGFTPRFTFPNGTLSIRTTWNRILRQYNSSFPAELRDTTGIVVAREVVQRHGFPPHIRIHEVEIRGPLNPAWPTASQRAILGDQPFTPDRTREILTTFATRAYRRPVLPDEVDRLLAVVARRQQSGQTPFDALKDGLKTVLCSPAFLYLAEPSSAVSAAPADRRLNAHALAARLSYFLWSTTPDPELTRSANTGELLQPNVLLAQTRRLLASPRADAFIHGLLDSWLNLRTLGDMAPDRGTFLRYYAEDLQSAMKRETQLFTRDLLDRNASIVRFLDADYTFANRPLARLYGLPNAIDGATGHEFRRIPVDPTQRGGLLGQASVLTVSANGIETSPVIRGVWLLENILGTPPAPPPDNVPPIDPDIRGAKSMREILTKHRDNPSCFECHRKIDPLGFALEKFDPIGAWRQTYEKNAPIDTSGELPGGHRFADVAGLKRVLVERKPQFARMLTERLLTYACGRRVEPLDRPAIDAILAATKPADYPFRDLLEQVVLSPTFRSK
jgi:mono/diheme cytochrome c family protein